MYPAELCVVARRSNPSCMRLYSMDYETHNPRKYLRCLRKLVSEELRIFCRKGQLDRFPFFSRRHGNGAKILSSGLFVTRLLVETRMAYRMIMMC